MPRFQHFYQDTLGSRFIKSLLDNTPLPNYECVVDGDHLVDNRYYIYKNFIIKCQKGGKLGVSASETLYPSSTLYPSAFLYPGTGISIARFYVLSYVDEEDIKTFSTYRSSKNYYDSETHNHLGRYLRYLKTKSNINLLPFYNVYDGTLVGDCELKRNSQGVVDVVRTSNQKYKVASVPIRFGKTYKIHIDCSSPVVMRCALRSSNGFLEIPDNKNDLPASTNTLQKVEQNLKTTQRYYSHMSFKSPITYRIESNQTDVVRFNDNIRLLIQLPKSNTSSIVVIEGDYDTGSIKCDKYSVVIPPDYLNLSLTYQNINKTPAFSHRLLEYLLGNVINLKDPISQNIQKIQSIFAEKDIKYKNSFISGSKIFGVWDNNIPKFVYKEILRCKDYDLLFDHDFNINSDVERLLSKSGELY